MAWRRLLRHSCALTTALHPSPSPSVPMPAARFPSIRSHPVRSNLAGLGGVVVVVGRLLSGVAWVDPPAGAVVDVPLAQTGEGIAECELLQWFVEEITKELSRLQQLASNNKLNSADIAGGTITLSNIGAIGGKFGAPLLNLPEVAIIAIGRIQKLPRFDDDGEVYPAYITNVNIGADHRVVDGAIVARFCNEWKSLVENPELLLLHMR